MAVNRWRILLTVLALASASLACTLMSTTGSNSATKTPAAQKSTTAKPGDRTGTPKAATPKAGSTTQIIGDLNLETLSLPDLNQGLKSLQSYRGTYKVVSENQTKSSTLEILQEVNNTSKNQHFRMSGSGELTKDALPAGAMEYYEIGTDTYILTSKEGGKPICISLSGGTNKDKPAMPMLQPAQLFGPVDKMKLVKKGEEVNDIVTDHYSYDQTNLTKIKFSSAKGDMWIAQDGGYVVKMTGQGTGKYDLFGKSDSEGDMSWDYQLDSVNKLAEIKPPVECSKPGLSTDIPVPPDTKTEAGFAGITTLKSTDSPAVVADFYRKEMPNQGWKVDKDSSFGEIIMIDLSKAGRKINIVINKDGSGSNIIITDIK